MENQAAIRPALVNAGLGGERVARVLSGFAVRIAIVTLLALAWEVRGGGLYTPASGFGYWIGLVGGSLMLALLIYPLRKRFRFLSVLGPLRHWFRFHLIAGIGGPLLVVFHSTFHVGSFNAAIALASMLLVVASGIVGRYIYRKIHHGLYGSRATAAELKGALAQQMESLRPLLVRAPTLDQELSAFSARVSLQPDGRLKRALHFISLDWRRHLAARRVRRAIMAMDAHGREHSAADHARLRTLARNIDNALKAEVRSAQFATYERLFALWHVVHIPFLCMLVVTAIVHVVAVHAY